MLTDKAPRQAEMKEEYLRSDDLRSILLPPVEPLRTLSGQLEQALKSENKTDIRRISNQIARSFSQSVGIPAPPVSILGARPLEVTETSQAELFGDYDFESAKIRLWMRTAVHKRTTSFGTFLSTLCHELCHHWDVVGLELPNTYHTRGFYERAGLLYHHMRGTPIRPLVWDELRGGLYSINWPKTMQGARR